MKKLIISLFVCLAIFSCTTKQQEAEKPNIIVIYVDDLGYGDIGANGAKGVNTPVLDKMVAEGVNFTDAHCSAATCTPSRYSLLTGKYAFRDKAGILPGDAPLLIDPTKETMPKMLQRAGYATAVVGKWHLGLGRGKVNWNEEVTPGPREIGFDYSFLIPATGDRVPCVYMENQKVVGLNPENPISVSYKKPFEGISIGYEHPELLRQAADRQHSGSIINGISRIGYMKGGEEAHWVDEDFPYVLTEKAVNFIDGNKEKPFFLYFAFHDIHVPRIPHPDFIGKSEMGPRGDAIAQVDWCTGQIVAKLEELGLAENTLIIFSSDNGPVLDDGYADEAEDKLGDHDPAGGLRGGKYSAFEAGTRVPTITYWPGKVKPGVSGALLTQTDLYASFAELVGMELQEGEAPDSKGMLDAWLGKSEKGREVMLEESFTLGIRKGNWKYIEPQRGKSPGWIKNKKIEGGFGNEDQLYNLTDDIGEQNNVAAEHPEVVEEMKKLLEEIRTNEVTR